MAKLGSLAAKEKPAKKRSSFLNRIWNRLFTRAKSTNATVGASTLNPNSIPSAPEVHDPVPELLNDDELFEARNAESYQDSAQSLGPIPNLLQSGSTVSRDAKQELQIPAVPATLPSQVDATLGSCPRFRILLVGNTGVGKSSLVANIFNIGKDKIDIAHNRAGDADIEYEYSSKENPRFLIHDSQGFEHGSDENWERIQSCIERRRPYVLPERIHAIWFCVEAPRPGQRLLQTGDERLLRLAKEYQIPIIAVFTKYDLLLNHFFREDRNKLNAEAKASAFFDQSTKELHEYLAKKDRELAVLCVKVSTVNTSGKETLIDLTKHTRDQLRDVEHKLSVLWVAAQQVNADQKVEVSISEGFKKYWLDLSHSNVFEGKILMDCIHRLHDDVLKVWNFNDPSGILSGISFFTEMIGLVRPLIEELGEETPSQLAYIPQAFGDGGATELVSFLQTFGLSTGAIHYLYERYQKYPSTAKLLATYIVNLVLILHSIFTNTLPSDPPRELSNDVVLEILKRHKTVLERESLDQIDLASEFSTHPEIVIRSEIRKRLPPDLKGTGLQR